MFTFEFRGEKNNITLDSSPTLCLDTSTDAEMNAINAETCTTFLMQTSMRVSEPCVPLAYTMNLFTTPHISPFDAPVVIVSLATNTYPFVA